MTIAYTLRDALYPEFGSVRASRPGRLMAGSFMGAIMLVVGPAAASPLSLAASPLSLLPHTALASFAATAAPLMIPEPASAALLVVGLTISAVAARRRRRRAKPQDATLS
jgi:hypothetical protein